MQSVFDTKTGKRKHHHPKVDFKVRYYNAASDKWSVSMLPLECFEPIEDVSEQVAILSSDIEKGVTYQVDVSLLEPILQSQFSEPFALLEPREVSYINGSYTLKAYDWIQNKTLVLDIPLPDFAAQISKDNLFLGDAFPDFDFTEGSRAPAWEGLFTEFNDFIAKYSDEKNYLVLTYINRAGNVTTRTIKDYFVVPKSTKTSSDYLQAYCCKKKERRSFRYDRIQSIKVLNLKV
ncbi:WYL domain-containing protein [Parapedobacter sp. ISTM3]|uniref:WYL domain-containing protein n=1 Tax=Parapedobacter sp. ISTM3 TaxID=2800130 RepID=UPI00351C4CAA